MSVDTWKRLESETIANCRVFEVRRDLCRNLKTAAEADFFVIENPDWVNIIPMTEDDEVLLIKQYRYGAEAVTLEIPGGMVDEGEPPEESARRELLEETGYSANKLFYLGRSQPNPALQNNWIHHFAAFGCVRTNEPDPDEHESIETRLVAWEEIGALISNEKITHSLVIAGFQRFQAFRESNHIYES